MNVGMAAFMYNSSFDPGWFRKDLNKLSKVI